MSQVSKYKVGKETEEKINNLFFESLNSCKSKENIAQFLDDLLTPTEKTVLSKRLAIAYLLIKNYPYQTIKDTLKVSTTTIGSVSLLLKRKGAGLRQILKQIITNKEWQKFFKEIAGEVMDIFAFSPGSDWKMAGKFKHQREMKKRSPF